MIELGSKVKCVITGFSGTITARTHYLSGKVSYLVEARYEDGKFNEVWMDETRLIDLGVDQEILIRRDLAATLKSIE